VVLRVLVAAGLLGSAWVHYDLWRTGFSAISVIGPLFLVNAVAGVVIAVASWPGGTGFQRSPRRIRGRHARAYLLSVTIGLFNVKEQFTSRPRYGAW